MGGMIYTHFFLSLSISLSLAAVSSLSLSRSDFSLPTHLPFLGGGVHVLLVVFHQEKAAAGCLREGGEG